MKLFRKQFKPTVKFFLVFLAVAGVAYLLFKDTLKESFADPTYAVVGSQIEGSLSTIYEFFTNKDPTKNLPIAGESLRHAPTMNEFMAKIVKSPVDVLGSLVDEFQNLKYYIIDDKTDKIIYDPISEYKKNKTMSPFPNTTEVGRYIVYSNFLKVLPRTRYIHQSDKAFTAKLCTIQVDNITILNEYKGLADVFQNINYIDRRNNITDTPEQTTTSSKITGLSSNVILTSNIGFVFMIFCALIKNINFVSFVYEDCTTDGFQNLEGFADTYNKLYDSHGKVIFEVTAAEPATKPAAEPATKPAESSNIQCCTIS
jgi:hypothetical protein